MLKNANVKQTKANAKQNLFKLKLTEKVHELQSV